MRWNREIFVLAAVIACGACDRPVVAPVASEVVRAPEALAAPRPAGADLDRLRAVLRARSSQPLSHRDVETLRRLQRVVASASAARR
jgi:hypothetical protein